MLIIHLNKTKTNKPRTFIVTADFESVKPISLYKKYSALRSDRTPHKRFFVYYNHGKCSIQPIGIHTLGAIPSKVATYLKLPDPKAYTGHCLRRTSATLFANAGGSKENLKRHGGWKSDAVAESYVEESISNKTKIAKKILGERNDQNDSAHVTIKTISDDKSLTISDTTSGAIHINNPSGCTFSFNITYK